jgi:hypothetical protein
MQKFSQISLWIFVLIIWHLFAFYINDDDKYTFIIRINEFYVLNIKHHIYNQKLLRTET